MIFVPTQYAYLLLTLPFLCVWVAFFVLNKATRREQLHMSIVGAIIGPLSEVVYFRDYWVPQSVFAVHVGSFILMPEDVLFGFAIVGIAGVIYEALAGKREVRSRKKMGRKYSSLQVLVIFIVALLLGIWFGLNSIYASAIAFLVASISMLWLRSDLLRDAVASGLAVMIIMFVCYFLVLKLVSNADELLRTGWLLYDTPLDWAIAGIPLTEMVWGFAMGFLSGPLYEFLNNKRLV